MHTEHRIISFIFIMTVVKSLYSRYFLKWIIIENTSIFNVKKLVKISNFIVTLKTLL